MLPNQHILRVNEIFGQTFQGEGQTMGKLSAFVRLSGCNLTCSWCDTPYTWDWKGLNGKPYDPKQETVGLTIDQIVGQITDNIQLPKGGHVVITGGEPMLQQTKLLVLLKELRKFGYKIEIETNGTVKVRNDEFFKYIDFVNCSPKLSNAGMSLDTTIKNEVLQQIKKESKNYIFKFVVKKYADLIEVDTIVANNKIPKSKVWIMPEGKTRNEHYKNLVLLADKIIEHGYNLSSRLHVLLWSSKRGK